MSTGLSRLVAPGSIALAIDAFLIAGAGSGDRPLIVAAMIVSNLLVGAAGTFFFGALVPVAVVIDGGSFAGLVGTGALSRDLVLLFSLLLFLLAETGYGAADRRVSSSQVEPDRSRFSYLVVVAALSAVVALAVLVGASGLHLGVFIELVGLLCLFGVLGIVVYTGRRPRRLVVPVSKPRARERGDRPGGS